MQLIKQNVISSLQSIKPAVIAADTNRLSIAKNIVKITQGGDTPFISKHADKTSVPNHVIPKEIHYVWLGNSPIPGNAVKNIISTFQKNPKYNITLWTDNPTKIKNTLLEAGYSKAILSKINIQQPNLSPKVAAAIARECTDTDFKNYAAASDIMRLAVLKDHGGIYMDVDVAMKNPLGDIKPQRQSSTGQIDCLIFQEKTQHGVRFSNAVIAAPQNSKGIEKMLDAAIAPYQGKIPEMGFGKTAGRGELTQLMNTYSKKGFSIDDFMWEGKRSVPSFRHLITVRATGPGIVSSYLDASGLSSNLIKNKLIAGTENFGQIDYHRNSPLGEWRQGMNADGHWVSQHKSNKSAEV